MRLVYTTNTIQRNHMGIFGSKYYICCVQSKIASVIQLAKRWNSIPELEAEVRGNLILEFAVTKNIKITRLRNSHIKQLGKKELTAQDKIGSFIQTSITACNN